MDEMECRIYSKKVDLSAQNIKEFYDKRAGEYINGGRKTRYTTVLLGDNNPEYAEVWNEFEKNSILPYLNTGQKHKILDIGCGVGRWAENLVTTCGEYIGTDFSEEMIRAALEYFKDFSNAHFINCSFQDLFTNDRVSDCKFDTVIIAGVSMYINDSELKRCFEQLNDMLNKGAIVYIEESVGVKERLTLNHIWSENLEDHYDAIYRTRDEYLELMKPLLTKNQVIKENYFIELDKKDMSKTSHWYALIRKGDF